MDDRLAAGLRNTTDALEWASGELDAGAFPALLKGELLAGRSSRLRVLPADANGQSLAGDLKGWPQGLSAVAQLHNAGLTLGDAEPRLIVSLDFPRVPRT